MTSRPDRALARADIDLCDELSKPRASIATAPFTLLSDDRSRDDAPTTTSLAPLVKVRVSPRATTSMNKYWFNPSWIEEDAVPGVDHGEFQSPVWLAVSMTMRADRDRELDGTRVRRLRRANDDQHAGQLRTLLSFVNDTTRLAASHHEVDRSTIRNAVSEEAGGSWRSYEPAPLRALRPGRFVHFISSSLKKVSVIHN